MRGTAVFLMICLLVSSGVKWEKGAESGCCVLVVEQIGEENDGCLTVGVGVSGAPGGICALMTVMTLPPGWEVRSVRKAEGAGNLTMTVRVDMVLDRVKDPEGCRVYLLFDGAEPAPGDGLLAAVTVCAPENNDTDRAGREVLITVKPAVLDGEKVPLYYMKENGITDILPVDGCTLTLTLPGREVHTTSQETEPETAEKDTPETVPDCEIPEPPELPEYGWTIVGCRERYPDGETMDVQLLFRAADGAGKGTPAAFPLPVGQGPGTVVVTVGETELGRDMCAVTFSGLPRTGRIRITGMTKNGENTVFFLLCYQDGEFDGWIPVFDRFCCDN